MKESLSDFILLNIYEGVFWISLAFVCGLVVMRGLPHRYRFLGVHTAVTLFVFGVTDSVENFTGGLWLYEVQWLFVLKAVCVLALVVSMIWFVHLRARDCCQ